MTWAVSATQVADWRLCTRKFLWKYVMGLRPPPKESSAKGTACHQVLEAWLNGQELSDAKLEVEGFVFDTAEIEAIVRPAMVHFPTPKTSNMTTEEKFRCEWRGITWTGRTDAWLGTPLSYMAESVVYDLKSTKAKRWIKSETELACDPQALLYGRVKGTSRVKFVYVLTTGKPRAVAVETHVVGPGPIEDLLVQDANDILAAVIAQHHPLTIEPGPQEACEAFGGCPYVGNCTDLKRGLLGRRQPGTKAAGGLLQLGTRKQDDMGMKEMMAKMQQSTTMEHASAGTNILPGNVTTTLPDGAGGVYPINTVFINPPESVDAGPPPLPPPPKQPAAPKRGGRPKKSQQPAANTSPPTETDVLPATSEQEEHARQLDAALAGYAVLVIRTLYVNCSSDAHPETLDLAKVMADAHAHVMRQCNVNHWYELPFSEGKAAMAAVCLEMLKQRAENAAGTLRVKCSSYLPETALVLGELQAAAAEVIR